MLACTGLRWPCNCLVTFSAYFYVRFYRLLSRSMAYKAMQSGHQRSARMGAPRSLRPLSLDSAADASVGICPVGSSENWERGPPGWDLHTSCWQLHTLVLSPSSPPTIPRRVMVRIWDTFEACYCDLTQFNTRAPVVLSPAIPHCIERLHSSSEHEYEKKMFF